MIPNFEVSDHAAQRFVERCWPVVYGPSATPPKKRGKLDTHIYGCYLNGKTVKPGEYPPDLLPWTQSLALRPGRHIRWNAEKRVGMVFMNDGQKIVVVTCFSAAIDEVDGDDVQKSLNSKQFYAIYDAISDVLPMEDDTRKLALAVRIERNLAARV